MKKIFFDSGGHQKRTLTKAIDIGHIHDGIDTEHIDGAGGH